MRMWTLLMLGLTFLCVHCAKEEAYDIQEYLQDLNGKVPVAEEQQATKVKRLWGVPDTTSSVGRIFNYIIPEDAFSGEIDRYVVTEAGEQVLPNWLYFESETRTFRGVPTEQDTGRVYISVKAVAKSSEEDDDPPVAKDVFSIEVIDDPSYSTKRNKCPHRAILTIMTVITDANMADLPPYRRYDLVVRMANALKLEPQEVKLGTLGGEAYDNQALAAGPGNTKTRDGAGVTLKWIVGCEGTIQDTEIVASVEKLSKNGKLSAELGLPVVGWHVTNQLPPTQIRTKRVNRAIYGTPVPGIVPTIWSSERIDDIESTDDTVVPESRVVPTMSSPAYTMSSHRHRHHHMLTDRGHHHHHILPSTPVFNLYSTPVIVPVLPSEHIQSSMYFPEESMESSTPVIYFTELISATPIITVSDITPSRSYPFVEPSKQHIPNFKPTIPNRLKKLSLLVGKYWTYQIPENTFFDVEDGNTRDLKIIFTTQENAAIPSNSWIQFDPEKQELYALPLIENVGLHYFTLEAMDSEGDVVQHSISLRVWNYSVNASHTFKIQLRYEKWQYQIGIDWQIEVLKRIAHLYKDPDTSSIVVRSVTLDPATFIWSNETLDDENICQREGISDLFKKLATNTSAPHPALRKIMKPEFKVLDVDIDFSGACLSKLYTSTPLGTTDMTKVIPIIRNPIDYINTTVGDVLQFTIPHDTFFHEEVGGTRNLKLILLTAEGKNKPGKSSWVQFDEKRQMIQALPEKKHVGEHVYQIVASDGNGNYVADVLKIYVVARKREKMVVEFSVKLNEDYETFQQHTMKKLLLARKIARIYGDTDASHMRIINISEGSVIYAWTNNSLPVDRCPKRKISQLVKKLITDDGKTNPEFIVALQPEFQVEHVWAMPLSYCLDEKIPFVKSVPSPTPSDVTDLPPPIVMITEEETELPTVMTTEEGTTIKPATTTSDDDIYITTVIPAVVIAIMLIIAAMVACFLYRKKRKGKMTMQDTSGFMSKGVPIIFADEIEEKPDPAKPPVIMKDEKPPLSQPTYQQTDSEEATTPQIDRREPQSDPPYQPPPPFTATREAKNGRPKATPTYRQPPPYYVPP